MFSHSDYKRASQAGIIEPKREETAETSAERKEALGSIFNHPRDEVKITQPTRRSARIAKKVENQVKKIMLTLTKMKNSIDSYKETKKSSPSGVKFEMAEGVVSEPSEAHIETNYLFLDTLSPAREAGPSMGINVDYGNTYPSIFYGAFKPDASNSPESASSSDDIDPDESEEKTVKLAPTFTRTEDEVIEPIGESDLIDLEMEPQDNHSGSDSASYMSDQDIKRRADPLESSATKRQRISSSPSAVDLGENREGRLLPAVDQLKKRKADTISFESRKRRKTFPNDPTDTKARPGGVRVSEHGSPMAPAGFQQTDHVSRIMGELFLAWEEQGGEGSALSPQPFGSGITLPGLSRPDRLAGRQDPADGVYVAHWLNAGGGYEEIGGDGLIPPQGPSENPFIERDTATTGFMEALRATKEAHPREMGTLTEDMVEFERILQEGRKKVLPPPTVSPIPAHGSWSWSEIRPQYPTLSMGIRDVTEELLASLHRKGGLEQLVEDHFQPTGEELIDPTDQTLFLEFLDVRTRIARLYEHANDSVLREGR